jgi:hypothetical protein
MSPSPPFPSAEEGLRHHLLLCQLDPVAPAELCRAFIEPLVGWLESEFPWADPHLCRAAAGEALVDYVRDPQRYRPEDGALPAYLRMAARGDLLNLLRKEGRHHRGRAPWSVVELGEEAGKIHGGDKDPSRLVQDREEEARWQARWQVVRQACTEEEQRVLDLMSAGERRTDVYAEALGLGELPAAEQERAVKRAKDRLKKRLEREGARHD